MGELSVSGDSINGFALLTDKTFLLADKSMGFLTSLIACWLYLQFIVPVCDYRTSKVTATFFDPVSPPVILVKYAGQLFFFKHVVIRGQRALPLFTLHLGRGICALLS